MKILHTVSYLISFGLVPTLASAQLLSEFAPNPDGGDPTNTTFELTGTPAASFDYWILSLENDGYSGLVDRASNVTGTYDANGFAVVEVPDLENPSFTVVLTDSFSGDTSTDIDPMDDGVLDTSSFGNILDALGVSDNAGDDATLYGALLGGTDVLYNGQFEPLLVFRDGTTGEWFNSVTVDFGDPTQRIGTFFADGTEYTGAFDIDPRSVDFDTYGSANPSAVPEPSAYALLAGMLTLGITALRRRRG